ncbi:MAG: Na+/H+ antiporter subunit E [Pararhodobacter sp.]|nr:Na+/H+ antiporter subunit E [Pararhodobacter sp.]
MLPAILKRAGLFSAIWIMLTGAAPDALAFGAAAVAAAVWLSLRLLPPVGTVRLLRMLALVPGFLWGSLSGGLDVARRAFRPRPGLRPGWVTFPTRLGGGARAALGGELSLMPGTLAAGCSDGRLIVHVLDTGAGFDQAIAQEERRIASLSHRA